MPEGWAIKKKFTLTLLVFMAGTALAFTSDAELGSYTAFATIILGAFGAADVMDKKLNGGDY